MSHPTLAQYQHEIGARLSRGDCAQAGGLAAECRNLWPDVADGWLLGSMAALFADQKELALALVDEWLATHPGDTPCWIQKAECAFALGHRDQAIAAVATATATAPDDPEALEAIGDFLTFAQEHEKALQVYDRAIGASPGRHAILSKRAVVHRYLGRFDAAAQDWESVLALSPTDAEALKGLAELRRQSPEANLGAALERALAAVPADSKDAAALHFALAKTYEELDDHRRSWGHLTAANRLERARLKYRPAEDRAIIEHLVAAFPGIESTATDTTGARPIFIVGLPRTGTTLVDRIIGSHSAVHSAGELSALMDAVAAVAVAEFPEISTDWLGIARAMRGLRGAAIAQEYLARTLAHRGDRAHFTDKAPANFFYCPLILRAFPRARILHLTRHPLAACHAIYKTRFNGGYPFAYDLGELADFYLGYRRLMAHWHAILPGLILDVAYEDVVTSQETATQRMLDYLELPFEAACLDFHLNPQAATTSSSVQVRQPLYESSLALWRHYTDELAPLRARLLAGGVAAAELDATLSAPG
jgi:tetratricopeptide (TPR) repeat protein